MVGITQTELEYLQKTAKLCSKLFDQLDECKLLIEAQKAEIRRIRDEHGIE